MIKLTENEIKEMKSVAIIDWSASEGLDLGIGPVSKIDKEQDRFMNKTLKENGLLDDNRSR